MPANPTIYSRARWENSVVLQSLFNLNCRNVISDFICERQSLNSSTTLHFVISMRD
jgi:hypothetical protein